MGACTSKPKVLGVGINVKAPEKVEKAQGEVVAAGAEQNTKDSGTGAAAAGDEVKKGQGGAVAGDDGDRVKSRSLENLFKKNEEEVSSQSEAVKDSDVPKVEPKVGAEAVAIAREEQAVEVKNAGMSENKSNEVKPAVVEVENVETPATGLEEVKPAVLEDETSEETSSEEVKAAVVEGENAETSLVEDAEASAKESAQVKSSVGAESSDEKHGERTETLEGKEQEEGGGGEAKPAIIETEIKA